MENVIHGQTYFDQNYRNYDKQNPPKKLAYYQSLLDRYRPAPLEMSIYDIGCGLGNFLAYQNDNALCFGSDVNAYAIHKAKQKVSNAQFTCATISNRPLFDRKFDRITSFDVLEQVPNLDGIGRVITKQLKPRGLFLFVVHVYDGLAGPVVWALGKNPTHLHKCGRNFWIQWAEKHFEVLHWEGILRYLLPSGYYLHVPTQNFRRHTPAIAVVCAPKEN